MIDFDPYAELIETQERVTMLEDLVDQLISTNNEQARLLQEIAKSHEGLSRLVLQNDTRINNLACGQDQDT
jgi:hypothetical protein